MEPDSAPPVQPPGQAATHPTASAQPVKRKRGRPRKTPLPSPPAEPSDLDDFPGLENAPIPVMEEMPAGAAPADSVRGPEQDRLFLGRPIRTFTKAEVAYGKRMVRDMEALVGDSRRARAMIERAVMYDIAHQRVELRIASMQEHGLTPSVLQKQAPYQEEADRLWDQFMKISKALGTLPSANKGQNDAEQTLADVHRKYLDELDARRAAGWRIGDVSPEAHKLAADVKVQEEQDVDLEPEDFKVNGALSDQDRKEFLGSPTNG